MYTTSAILSALALISPVLSAPTADISNVTLVERQVPNKPCAPLHVIAAGGDGTNEQGTYGLIGSLANKITQKVPGSNSVTLNYDKSYGQQIRKFDQGATLLHNYIADYHSHCPNSKIALLGYSAGAIITMNTLCGAAPPFSTPPGPIGSGGMPGLTSKIVATVVYGDQTRTPGPAYDMGSCGQSCVGRFKRPNANRCVHNFQYQSYCDTNDPECDANGPAPNGANHFLYPGKYDNQASQFVVNQFHAS